MRLGDLNRYTQSGDFATTRARGRAALGVFFLATWTVTALES